MSPDRSSHRTRAHRFTWPWVLVALAPAGFGQGVQSARSRAVATPSPWVPPASSEYYFDDFEGDTSGWTQAGCTGDCSVEWYFAQDGQCGSVSRMMVFNNPDNLCLYGWVDQSLTGSIVSPAITLSGTGPFSVSMDAIVDNDISYDAAAIYIQDDAFAPTRSELVALLIDWAPFVDSYSFPIPDSGSWAGQTVYLRFVGSSDNNDGHESARGWYVDNLRVHDTNGITGAPCLPALVHRSEAQLGSSLQVTLTTRRALGSRVCLWLGPRSAAAGSGDCTPFAGLAGARGIHGPAWKLGGQPLTHGAQWTVDVPARPALAGLELQLQAVGRARGRAVATPVGAVTLAGPH